MTPSKNLFGTLGNLQQSSFLLQNGFLFYAFLLCLFYPATVATQLTAAATGAMLAADVVGGAVAGSTFAENGWEPGGGLHVDAKVVGCQ